MILQMPSDEQKWGLEQGQRKKKDYIMNIKLNENIFNKK